MKISFNCIHPLAWRYESHKYESKFTKLRNGRMNKTNNLVKISSIQTRIDKNHSYNNILVTIYLWNIVFNFKNRPRCIVDGNSVLINDFTYSLQIKLKNTKLPTPDEIMISS